ncbi:hypothetical protein Anapl_08757 [Anas platyrhynchos]|uniref:Uncharacterized protein n=1 Tax=Anas platyrhynchos TaxID=8839 RepID=R0JSF3_ANAPL|nr:hypothetical protein Anapl_08757 [Anas platyrhynchos]
MGAISRNQSLYTNCNQLPDTIQVKPKTTEDTRDGWPFMADRSQTTIRLLVKAYRHAANPPHYCLTRVEKACSHNKQLTISPVESPGIIKGFTGEGKQLMHLFRCQQKGDLSEGTSTIGTSCAFRKVPQRCPWKKSQQSLLLSCTMQLIDALMFCPVSTDELSSRRMFVSTDELSRRMCLLDAQLLATIQEISALVDVAVDVDPTNEML